MARRPSNTRLPIRGLGPVHTATRAFFDAAAPVHRQTIAGWEQGRMQAACGELSPKHTASTGYDCQRCLALPKDT